MEIIIRMLTESHSLMVNPDTTVGSLRTLIQDRLGVPSDRQRLLFDNGHRTSLTDNSRTISSYGLHSGSLVTLLVLQAPPTFQVVVKNKKGKSSTYNITAEETVEGLKQKVQADEGVAVSQQRLVFEGREMKSGKLSDYKVREHSTIFMVLEVFVKNEKGKTSTYDITAEETVEGLKQKVQVIEEVAVSQQRLVFESREMTSGKLSDYKVREHSTIFMVLRLRGG